MPMNKFSLIKHYVQARVIFIAFKVAYMYIIQNPANPLDN